MLVDSPHESRLPSRIREKEGLSYIVQTMLNVPSLDHS